MEVATGVAHPSGGLHHNNKIPPDYTRVEVHTMKPEFMQWRIDYATSKRLVLLGDVMGQFILWHKWDIILTASSLPPPLSNLERVVEDGEIFSPSRDPHIPEMPHSSPPPSEHVPDEMPQPSLAVPSKCIMRYHSLVNKHSRYMNNECLLKKVMHKEMRTCLNGNFERSIQSP